MYRARTQTACSVNTAYTWPSKWSENRRIRILAKHTVSCSSFAQISFSILVHMRSSLHHDCYVCAGVDARLPYRQWCRVSLIMIWYKHRWDATGRATVRSYARYSCTVYICSKTHTFFAMWIEWRSEGFFCVCLRSSRARCGCDCAMCIVETNVTQRSVDLSVVRLPLPTCAPLLDDKWKIRWNVEWHTQRRSSLRTSFLNESRMHAPFR